MTKSRNLISKKKQWSIDEEALLRALYPCTKGERLASFFNCNLHQIYHRSTKLGLKKSQWFKDSPMAQRLRIDGTIGKPYQFPKGHVPANKGKKVGSFPGMEKTQFKPGQVPASHRPVGSTRLCSKQGYVLMKMAEGMHQWRPIHRIIYQRMHGKVPHGHIVTFVDSNRENISITNLTSITIKQHCLNNSVNKYGDEIADLYRLKGRITKAINKRERANHE